MFPEALLLHYMDDLDSKMEAMRAHFEREADLESPWTSYNASLGRPLLNSAKFLAPKPAAHPEDSPSAAEAEAEAETASESSEKAPTLPGLGS
jgi:3'-5' exoribonuclease